MMRCPAQQIAARGRGRACGRRSFVIMSVFIIVLLALLLVAGMIYLTQSETAARARTAAQAQMRADVTSASRVLMSELNGQRDRILNGSQPRLRTQYTLYETSSAVGVVRLLPIGHMQRRLVPEAGKLDLNEVSADELAATNIVDAAMAQRIINARSAQFGGTFRSIGDLCRIDGISPETVFGPIDRALVRRQTQRSADADRLDAAPASDSVPRALIDVATVYGFEPALQRNGNLRINLNVEWSDELGQRVNKRFGEGAAQVLRNLFRQTTFDDDAKIVAALLQFDVSTEDWAEILDALTTEAGEVHFGRVDINTASRQVLAALPGIEPEQAAQLVQMRDGLSEQQRWTITWPLTAGLLERTSYESLAGRITTRCWTYRVRCAIGSVSPDEPTGPMDKPAIYEMVVDLSGPEPRMAYLRDISSLEAMALIAAQASARSTAEPPAENDDDEADDSGIDADLPATDASGAGSTAGGRSRGFELNGRPDGGGTAGGNSSPSAGGVERSSRPIGEPEAGETGQRRRVGRWQGG